VTDQFKPEMDDKTRKAKLKGWRDAVRRTLSQ
jgi:glycerol kinase